jgi:acyl-CoA dehydrogenase
MLMLMKSQTEAMRALAYVVAAALDFSHKDEDRERQKQHQAFVDLMIPVVKGWCTETGIEVASLGVQVHGGMGFVEETGAAQYLRDARITTIYEGTTGIQAMDLVGRKIARDGGAAARSWLASVRQLEAELAGPATRGLGRRLANGAQAVSDCVEFIVAQKDPVSTFAGAVPFLKLMGIVAGGWQMARAALAAQANLSKDPSFHEAKLATARFYGDQVLVQAPGLRDTVLQGGGDVMALTEEQFLSA